MHSSTAVQPSNQTRWWRTIPLRWVMTAAVGLPITAIIAFQVLFFPSQQHEQALSALAMKARTVTELIAHDVRAAIEYDDLVMANSVFQGATQDADLAYVVALRPDGTTFAAVKPELAPGKKAEAVPVTTVQLDEALGQVIVRTPVKLEKGEAAMLLAGFSMERVRDDMRRSRNQTLTSGMLVRVAGLVLALWLGSFIGSPLRGMTSALESMAGGDLTQQVTANAASGEIALMSDSFNRTMRELRRIVSGLRNASLELDTSAQEILAASRKQEAGSSEQTASIDEISHAVTAVAETARGIAEHGQHLMEIGDEMLETMRETQSAVTTARGGMNEIVVHQKIVVDRVNQLYERSQSVISVVDIIDGISDRLDLLALNAALEGSRAGELGKGFSLVAQEMRRLAENVIGSTKHIKTTIEEIQRLIQGSLDANQQGSTIVARGAQEMERMGVAIDRVFELIQRTTEAARHIGITTQQQLSSTEQSVKAMQEISTISMQSSKAAQDVTTAAGELTALSVNLRETVAVFRVGEDA